jgi:hypothetical protein
MYGSPGLSAARFVAAADSGEQTYYPVRRVVLRGPGSTRAGVRVGGGAGNRSRLAGHRPARIEDVRHSPRPLTAAPSWRHNPGHTESFGVPFRCRSAKIYPVAQTYRSLRWKHYQRHERIAAWPASSASPCPGTGLWLLQAHALYAAGRRWRPTRPHRWHCAYCHTQSRPLEQL